MLQDAITTYYDEDTLLKTDINSEFDVFAPGLVRDQPADRQKVIDTARDLEARRRILILETVDFLQKADRLGYITDAGSRELRALNAYLARN